MQVSVLEKLDVLEYKCSLLAKRAVLENNVLHFNSLKNSYFHFG